MRTIKKVLLIEDNLGDARLLREMFKEDSSLDIELTCVGFMADAEKHLDAHFVDVVLLDLGLPDAQGLAAIRRVRVAAPGIPLVVLTGMDDEALAAQSLQEGAQDYLIKGQIETRGLMRALRYAGERKRLERMKDEFVATVSHELRTPLTSIAGSLGLLTSKAAGSLSGPAARLLEIAHSNSQRLVRLVNDILDIEKLNSGHVVFDLRRVDVRSLVQESIDAIEDFARGLGVRIRIEASAAVHEVRADADRLAQVVTNLLSNAVKFSPPNGEIVVTIENRAGSVRILVRDHGPGIAAEFKSRVFERFAQADATNARRKGGTGLGLSIVQEIVDRLAGKVGFDDAAGGGSVFHVELPAWVGLARDEDAQALASEASEASLGNLTAVSSQLSFASAGAAKEAI